jgi:hypothetical protein
MMTKIFQFNQTPWIVLIDFWGITFHKSLDSAMAYAASQIEDSASF